MISTAQWLHFKLGMPLQGYDGDEATADEAQTGEADLIARQKALASMPLSVTFLAR